MKHPIAASDGFSLVEALVALGITSVALLGVAGMFVKGVTVLASSQFDLIAREKAAEAIESVFAARDSHVITWEDIRNREGVSGTDGGVFDDGPRLLRDPGRDGLVNTLDDGAVQRLATPGADNLLGTADDELMPLEGLTREIEIREVNPTLRQIRVIVTYPSGGATRRVEVITMISSFA